MAMAEIPGVSIAQMQPSVDFVCLWQVESEVWYRYRIPSHQILLVEEGRLRARTAHGQLEAGVGEALCLRHEPQTEYGFSGRVRYYETHLSFAPPPRRAAPLLVDGAPLPEHVSLGGRHEAARRAFELLCLNVPHSGDRNALRIRLGVDQLVGALIGGTQDPPVPVVRVDDPWQRARARLESELGRNLTLGSLARQLGISEDHFIRGFRRRFGLSPMAYRSQARLRWAATALAGDAQATSIKRIAHQLGFTDASAFSRAFRRQFGLAPSELRVAGEHAVLPAAGGSSAHPYPLNRHLRPAGAKDPWFLWV